MKHLLVSLCLIPVIMCVQDKEIVRARIESCPGCSLNRLPEVKQFIFEDVPKYANVEFKKISGAPPELLFLNKNNEIVERHSLKTLNRKQCNELLKNKGFSMRTNREL